MNTIQGVRFYNVAFTGHRPKDAFLGDENVYTQKNHKILVEFATQLLLQLEKKRANGDYGNVDALQIITGGALGWDQAVAEATAFVMGMRLVVVQPFKGFGYNWPEDSKRRYSNILAVADTVKTLEQPIGTPIPRQLHLRNEYMVDHCDELVALYDYEGSQASGTGNCVRYFQKKYPGKKYMNVWKAWVNYYLSETN